MNNTHRWPNTNASVSLLVIITRSPFHEWLNIYQAFYNFSGNWQFATYNFALQRLHAHFHTLFFQISTVSIRRNVNKKCTPLETVYFLYPFLFLQYSTKNYRKWPYWQLPTQLIMLPYFWAKWIQISHPVNYPYLLHCMENNE